jgi:hypothetical protein
MISRVLDSGMDLDSVIEQYRNEAKKWVCRIFSTSKTKNPENLRTSNTDANIKGLLKYAELYLLGIGDS